MPLPEWETLEASGIMIGAVSLIIMGVILLFFGNKYLIAVFGATGFMFGSKSTSTVIVSVDDSP